MSERAYLGLLADILENGEPEMDRTGVGTRSVFGRQLRFDLREGFPLLTTKKMFTKGIVAELIWFLRGDTNIKFLTDHGVHIWDAWADENGDLGPVYGKQWRAWPEIAEIEDGVFEHETIDQIGNLLANLRSNPGSRRHVVTAWNPAEVDQMALPPCHCLFQFKVYGEWLDCQLYQRSGDAFLGVPFNIATYSLLTHIVARHVGLKPRFFVHTFGDVHIYNNHVEQCQEQISRQPFRTPTLIINREPPDLIEDYEVYDFLFSSYTSWPAIKAPVAV